MKPPKTKIRKSRNRTQERLCDKAILDTLRYRALFNASISFFQLCTFTIAKKKLDEDTFKQRLNALIKNKKVAVKKDKFYVSGIKPNSWNLRAKYSKNHIYNSQFAFDILSRIRWIKLLAVTGSVAAYGATKKDDIDIFIVTEVGRLWITRFFVVLVLKTLGIYYSEEHPEGKVCPNLYIDSSDLKWPKDQHNVYVAHEIVMMQPIIDRDNTYNKFLRRNDWISDYFVNFDIDHIPSRFKRVKNRRYSKTVDVLDHYLMNLQKWYMRKRQTTEITTAHKIHFNKHDHLTEIVENFAKVTA